MPQKRFGVLLALAAGGIAFAQASSAPAIPDEEKLVNRLMLHQDVVAVNNVASAADFVPDKDPNTLQVVFLSDPNAKSAVSEDGEVVFLNPAYTIDDQAKLTREAFRRKLHHLPPPDRP